MDGATPPLAVDARHLVKRYGSMAAVDGVDLQLRAGATFSLLGTNGAVETTTVEMLAGLRRPTQGSVRVLGLNPFSDDADDCHRRKKLDVVNEAGQQAWREWMHAPVTASDAEPTMLAKVYLLGRLPAADRRACVRRGAARADRGGCRSARLVGGGTRCYRGLGRRPGGLPLPAGPGPRHPCACLRNAVARREETA